MTDKIIDIVAESLCVYRKVLVKTWLRLCAVLFPVYAFLVLVHCQVAMRFDAGDGIPLIALVGERRVGWVLQVTVGLLAFVVVCRAAWREIAKPSDESDMASGLARAWGRAFGTLLLLLFLVGASMFIALFCIFFALPKVFSAISLRGTSMLDLLQTTLLFTVLAGIAFVAVKWMLAVPVSAIFPSSGSKAMDVSSGLTRGRRFMIMVFAMIAVLVSNAFAIVPRCVMGCDVLNLAHPFTECTAVGKCGWAVAMCAAGVASNVAALFGAVALVVCIRRLKEPVGAGTNLPRRLAISLVLAGIALSVAWEGLAVVRPPRGFRYLDEARVFRIENMEEDEAPSALDVRKMSFCFCGHGEAWFEKRGLLGLFSRDRVAWVEIPFCSHCGSVYSAYTDCDSHGCDVFVRRSVVVRKGGGSVISTAFHDIRPRDSQRPATPEERKRIMGRVEKERSDRRK